MLRIWVPKKSKQKQCSGYGVRTSQKTTFRIWPPQKLTKTVFKIWSPQESKNNVQDMDPKKVNKTMFRIWPPKQITNKTMFRIWGPTKSNENNTQDIVPQKSKKKTTCLVRMSSRSLIGEFMT